MRGHTKRRARYWRAAPVTYYGFSMRFIHDTATHSCVDMLDANGRGVPRKHSSSRPEPSEGRPHVDRHHRETVQGGVR